MQHEPGGLLCHPNVQMQLHARHAFQAGQFQVGGEDPLPKRGLGPLQRRPDPDGERLPATDAAVGQSGRRGRSPRLRTSTPRAMAAVRPYQELEPYRG